MKPLRTLVWWQNIPSILQAPLIGAIAEAANIETLVITSRDMPEERIQLGWRRPAFGRAEIVVAPTDKERDVLESRYCGVDVLNVFSGFQGDKKTYESLKRLSNRGSKLAIFAEPGRGNDGIKSVFRRALYRAHALRWGNRIEFLLATGALGEAWYTACGFRPDKIFPFGYFVERKEDESGSGAEAARSCIENPAVVRLIFVGELVWRKGVDLLLRALTKVRAEPWQLEVVGTGAQAEDFQRMSYSLGLGGKVKWLGSLQNDIARVKVARADGLILPSRFDGWGAVINEALLSGTRVLVTDRCGASDLVREDWRGQVVKAGSAEALESAVLDLIHRGALCGAERTRIRMWAANAIDPTVAARYFLAVCEFVKTGGSRPGAPWRSSPNGFTQ